MLQKLFKTFLEAPSQANYRAVRQAVIEAPTYKPLTDQLQVVAKLHEQQRWDDVLMGAEIIMSNYLLTPALHFYAGQAQGALGNAEAENLERHIFAVCRKALLDTGDGSVNQPYLVTHVDEIYELLAALGQQPTKKALVKHEDGRFFDVFTDDNDENETWFDITDIQKHAPKESSGENLP